MKLILISFSFLWYDCEYIRTIFACISFYFLKYRSNMKLIVISLSFLWYDCGYIRTIFVCITWHYVSSHHPFLSATCPKAKSQHPFFYCLPAVFRNKQSSATPPRSNAGFGLPYQPPVTSLDGIKLNSTQFFSVYAT